MSAASSHRLLSNLLLWDAKSKGKPPSSATYFALCSRQNGTLAPVPKHRDEYADFSPKEERARLYVPLLLRSEHLLTGRSRDDFTFEARFCLNTLLSPRHDCLGYPRLLAGLPLSEGADHLQATLALRIISNLNSGLQAWLEERPYPEIRQLLQSTLNTVVNDLYRDRMEELGLLPDPDGCLGSWAITSPHYDRHREETKANRQAIQHERQKAEQTRRETEERLFQEQVALALARQKAALELELLTLQRHTEIEQADRQHAAQHQQHLRELEALRKMEDIRRLQADEKRRQAEHQLLLKELAAREQLLVHEKGLMAKSAAWLQQQDACQKLVASNFQDTLEQIRCLQDGVASLTASLRDADRQQRQNFSEPFKAEVFLRSFPPPTSWSPGTPLRAKVSRLETVGEMDSGDSFQLIVTANRDAYVSLVGFGPERQGHTTTYRFYRYFTTDADNDLGYPFPIRSNRLLAGEILVLPADGGINAMEGHYWTLNTATGVESLYAVLTLDPLPPNFFDDLQKEIEESPLATRGPLTFGDLTASRRPGRLTTQDPAALPEAPVQTFRRFNQNLRAKVEPHGMVREFRITHL